MATLDEVEFTLAYLAMFYPQWNIPPATMQAWAELLEDIPADALMAAAKQHAVTSKWPPTLAELRQPAQQTTRQALPTFAEAWDEVMERIRSGGSWHLPTWSHPLIERTVAGMGGWLVMCSMPVDETATWRAQFRDMFAAYANRAEADAKLLPEVKALRDTYAALPKGETLAAPAVREVDGFKSAGQVIKMLPRKAASGE
jgi:hypothetical protein